MTTITVIFLLLQLHKSEAFSTQSSGAQVEAIRKHKTNTQWIACSSTTEVTRAIQKYVRTGDTVAELGSQLRESSTTLCETIGHIGRAILVDIERKFPNEKKNQQRTLAMRRKGDESDFYTDRATFTELESFDFWRDALFFRHGRMHYNILVVDMSTVAGNDLDLSTIALIKEFMGLNGSGFTDNPCRAIIVKSASLQNLARRLHHAQHIISGRESIYDSSHTHIIGSVGVKQYRETIPHVIKKGNVCVELGCHLGTTTAIIDRASRDNDRGGCLGVDVGSQIINSARKKYTHLSFEVGDGFKTGALARMRDEHFGRSKVSDPTYDVVFVDIGGLSGSEGLLEALSLLSSITNSFSPHCIVIKSLCIRRLSSNLVSFADVWNNEVATR